MGNDLGFYNPLGIQEDMRRRQNEEDAAWRKREGKRGGQSPWDSWDSTVKEHLRQINMESPSKRKESLQSFADWFNEQTVLGNMKVIEYRKLKAKYHLPGPRKNTWRYTTARGYKPHKG